MSGLNCCALILPLTLLTGCLGPYPDDKNRCRERDSGDEMIVYSLAGGFPSLDASDPTLNGGSFHGWQVLGKTTVTSENLRGRIRDALDIGIRKHDGSVAACFNPHHAIRLRHNGKTEDWVICFMCNQIYVFENERKVKTTLVSTSPRPLLNEVLRSAKVPLSDKAE